MSEKRYGNFEQVNGAVVNDALDTIDQLTAQMESLNGENSKQANWIHLTKSHAPYQAAVGEFQCRAEYWAKRAENAEAELEQTIILYKSLKEMSDKRLTKLEKRSVSIIEKTQMNGGVVAASYQFFQKRFNGWGE